MGQLAYVAQIEEHIYLVPFVPFVPQTDGTRFLKTIIPSRKATKEYGRKRLT